MNMGAKKHYGVVFNTQNTKVLAHTKSQISFKSDSQFVRERRSLKGQNHKSNVNDNILRRLVSKENTNEPEGYGSDILNLEIDVSHNKNKKVKLDDSKEVLIRAGSMKLIGRKSPKNIANKENQKIIGINTGNNAKKSFQAYTPKFNKREMSITPLGIPLIYTDNLIENSNISETPDECSQKSVKSGRFSAYLNRWQNSENKLF